MTAEQEAIDMLDRLRYADEHSQQRALGSRIFGEAADEIERLRAEIEQIKRGEFICKKCGLRKDSEHESADF